MFWHRGTTYEQQLHEEEVLSARVTGRSARSGTFLLNDDNAYSSIKVFATICYYVN